MKVEITIQNSHIDDQVSIANISPNEHPLALAIREYFVDDSCRVEVNRCHSQVIFFDGREITINHSRELNQLLKWAEERGRMSACSMIVELPPQVKFCLVSEHR